MLTVDNIRKLTDRKWLNLYTAEYTSESGKKGFWDFASRRERDKVGPSNSPDAVVVVPIVQFPEGRKIALLSEYRIPIESREWHFVAGLVDAGEDFVAAARRELAEEAGLDLVQVRRISPLLVSSAGLSDESSVMVFADCVPNGLGQQLEGTEDIKVVYLDQADLARFMASDSKIAAKAWPVLLMYAILGHFEI